MNKPGLLHENVVERFKSFLIDLIVFAWHSIFHILESVYLTVLPDAWRQKKDVSGQVVLITGGAGGVGKELALNFAKLKARVVIWDINSELIQQTVELLEDEGYKCKGYRVDISDRDMVYQMAEKLREDIGDVDILVNNAGIVACKPFWEIPDRMIESTYNVNIISHYWTVKAFLPAMMSNNKGHIVTVGSVTGLMGAYGCSDYSATKYACNGLHESLFIDLRSHGYDGIDMTLICPYYINTGMFNGVRPRLFPMLEPKYVADQIAGAVQKRQTWCVLPGSLKTLLPLKCLLPAKMCWELMSRVIRGPDSMMLFQRKGKVPAG